MNEQEERHADDQDREPSDMARPVVANVKVRDARDQGQQHVQQAQVRAGVGVNAEKPSDRGAARRWRRGAQAFWIVASLAR